MRFMVTAGITIALLTTLDGSACAQSPINSRQLERWEQINAAVDLVSKFRTSVSLTFRGRETESYNRLAVESFKCALLYGLLSQTPPAGRGPTSFTFKNASDIFNLVSGFIYAGGLENYKSEVILAKEEVLNIRKNNEELKLHDTLRSCSELAESQGATLNNAITRIMLK